MFNVFTGAQLLGYRQPASKAELRQASHVVADMIYEELTGIRGIFATRIAYVTVSGALDARQFGLVVADADGENARVRMVAK